MTAQRKRAFSLERFTEEVEALVNIDSGTRCREGVNAVGQWFARRFEGLGWSLEWFSPDPALGRSFFAVNADSGEADLDLLILCHLDTVFPEGEAARRPFSMDGERMYGPGVADMKSGCLFTWYALEDLSRSGLLTGRVGVFYNAEHEIGAPNTRPIIESLCQRSRVVISAESARANGAYVKQRKGIGRYTVEFWGKGAHSGNNPEEGECAITEAAHWVLFLKGLCDAQKGVFINPGIISGGMSPNVIPDKATLSIDTRFTKFEDGQRIEALIREKAAAPFNPGIRVAVEGNITRPPMVPNAGTEKLCRTVASIGAGLGVTVTWAFAGGGSDASFASPFGMPALCGLTGVGGKLHSREEYLEIRDLEARYEVYRQSILSMSANEGSESGGQNPV